MLPQTKPELKLIAVIKGHRLILKLSIGHFELTIHLSLNSPDIQLASLCQNQKRVIHNLSRTITDKR